jgi:hypothetical protein
MGTVNGNGQTLRATLCEIERGVFYATYPDCEFASGAEELTSYQVGTSADDAKRRISQSARALGYETIIWTETIIAPLFASEAGTALPEQATISVA